MMCVRLERFWGGLGRLGKVLAFLPSRFGNMHRWVGWIWSDWSEEKVSVLDSNFSTSKSLKVLKSLIKIKKKVLIKIKPPHRPASIDCSGTGAFRHVPYRSALKPRSSDFRDRCCRSDVCRQNLPARPSSSSASVSSSTQFNVNPRNNNPFLFKQRGCLSKAASRGIELEMAVAFGKADGVSSLFDDEIEKFAEVF